MAMAAQPLNELENILQTSDLTKDSLNCNATSLNDVGLEVAQETVPEEPLKFRVLKSTDIPSLHH